MHTSNRNSSLLPQKLLNSHANYHKIFSQLIFLHQQHILLFNFFGLFLLTLFFHIPNDIKINLFFSTIHAARYRKTRLFDFALLNRLKTQLNYIFFSTGFFLALISLSRYKKKKYYSDSRDQRGTFCELTALHRCLREIVCENYVCAINIFSLILFLIERKF